MTAGLIVGIAFLALGVVAYSGVWKGWIRVRRGYGSTIGFAWLWLGLSFTTASVATSMAAASRPLLLVLLAVAAVLLVVAIVGFFWLPPFLLPAWYRVLRGDDVRPKGRP
ncbi:MAG: hypothetical protein FJW64_16710 [Actinobacteria bacterium]|nr:hypothetical protein [Actinomycetota bacterium]